MRGMVAPPSEQYMAKQNYVLIDAVLSSAVSCELSWTNPCADCRLLYTIEPRHLQGNWIEVYQIFTGRSRLYLRY